MFEIGSSSIILPAKVSSSPESLEYNDYEEYQEVTLQPSVSYHNSAETGQQHVTYDVHRKGGDQQHISYGVPQSATEEDLKSSVVTGIPPIESSLNRQADFVTGKTPPDPFQVQRFYQQEPQVIDVEEFDETGIGKAICIAGPAFSQPPHLLHLIVASTLTPGCPSI